MLINAVQLIIMLIISSTIPTSSMYKNIIIHNKILNNPVFLSKLIFKINKSAVFQNIYKIKINRNLYNILKLK